MKQNSVILLLVFLAALFLIANLPPIKFWLAARFAKVDISLASVFGMWLKRIPLAEIVNPLIASSQTHISVSRDELIRHYRAGGNVMHVVTAQICAQKVGVSLTFAQAAAFDLDGRDVPDMVRQCVEPRIVNCPDARNGNPFIRATTQDGVSVNAKAKLTIKDNISRLENGIPEGLLVARVSEAIRTAIRSEPDHATLLDDPDRVARKVLHMNLDNDAAVSIEGLDIELEL